MGRSPYTSRFLPFGRQSPESTEKGLESPHVDGYMLSIDS